MEAIFGAAPDRPGATIQNCDLVSPRFFRERSAQANSNETLQNGPKSHESGFIFTNLRLHKKEISSQAINKTAKIRSERAYQPFESSAGGLSEI